MNENEEDIKFIMFGITFYRFDWMRKPFFRDSKNGYIEIQWNPLDDRMVLRSPPSYPCKSQGS